MSEAQTCPRCDQALADAGGCPTCSQRMGRYKIVRLIGEGGMRVVYEAEQDQPRRTVALKVIKPGMASLALLKCFEQEAQALGLASVAEARKRSRTWTRWWLKLEAPR